MGRRSRKRARGKQAAVPARAAAPARRRSGEERDAEVRARLEPLAEGERPRAVTVAVVVAVALGVVAVVGYLTGTGVGKQQPTLVSLIVFEAILVTAAIGMWRARYWAVLGFQALLAFQIIVAALSLAVASNAWAVVLTVSIIVFGGLLFWKLVRALARIQLPDRSARQR